MKHIEKDNLITDSIYVDENKIIQERSIDAAPIIESNKKLYTHNDGYSKSRELKRVASIPTIVLEIWSKEYHKDNNKGNWFALPKEVQQKILKQKLNSSEFQYFRTAPGKI
jgi:hypothetical protein|tara:strand:- start:111 stop:443 length:333 start_codon:yes stop_codon:yes gene_type:complete